MENRYNWAELSQMGYLASGIDPADRRGRKNAYIDTLQKAAIEEVLELKGDETVLDFGCGSGRIAYWIAPRVKEVIGLEVTPEMIESAEKNRIAGNVKFIVYDGTHFPALSKPVDFILSVGVLQIMKGDGLRQTLSCLTRYLRTGGRLCLIEQASDNPRIQRPRVRDYLRAFEEAGLDCLSHYAIRNGRWWLLYLIRYGVIAEGWHRRLACYELDKRRKEKGLIHYYQDFLFLLQKG